MKAYLKNLAVPPCLAAVLLAWTGTSNATLVTVDSSITAGYMAWFNLNASGGKGTYIDGKNWGISAIKSTVGATSIILEANYNTYADNPGSDYWRDNGGAGPGGNKWMEASSFANISASSFTDDLCNFKAKVSAYSFGAGYTVRAFIKGFNANYSTNEMVFSGPLVAGSDVNLELDTTPWVNIQYGFEVQGINANPAFSPGSATAVATVAPPLVYGIPNPGFEIPNGAQWAFDKSNGPTDRYPDSGGNPGGYAEIDATAATQPYYGVLVSNGRFQLPLAALSLTPGQKCTFAMDMKIVEGTNIGGFKVDFVPGNPLNPADPNDRMNSTGELYPTPSESPGEWSTYSFPVTIPANATGLKLVPLWAPASTVGYDNIRLAGPFAANISIIASNAKISWPTVTGRSYQVRKCDDLVNWAPFGAPISGNGATLSVTNPIVVTPPGKAFFQVIETTP